MVKNHVGAHCETYSLFIVRLSGTSRGSHAIESVNVEDAERYNLVVRAFAACCVSEQT